MRKLFGYRMIERIDAARLRVAVVGGGIGDLALALALVRRGMRADVYEQADTWRRRRLSLAHPNRRDEGGVATAWANYERLRSRRAGGDPARYPRQRKLLRLRLQDLDRRDAEITDSTRFPSWIYDHDVEADVQVLVRPNREPAMSTPGPPDTHPEEQAH